ncbi:hypothetical protein C0Q70_09709 [Pomacea canaliculata]|uniref:Cytochrome P450 n=1 Tax=Pomacea canaliculata TaxID=400727 RepID=A0A2T7PAK5_POMCA|nr:uncharacterized protein LOC112564351 isoform X2 [Pomacea canaliculata]PVD30443.1 hypothetical protein C0Q70_09709 [Pomacea canaliculata]
MAAVPDRCGNFEHGYRTFMEQIFGDNILFADDDKAHMFRDALGHLFTPDAVYSCEEDIKRIVQYHVATLDANLPLCVYTFFKEVVTEICLSLFLGLDFHKSLEETKNVLTLTTAHWHGITSVPLQFKVPGTSHASTYSHALEAKEKLLKIIQAQRHSTSQRFLKQFEEVASYDQDMFVNNHLLLFSSALVPKAIASLLTSFAIELGTADHISLQSELKLKPDLKSSIFQEVLRLYPPFLGGRRIARKDVVVDGYRIPQGHAVVYITYTAHRDAQVFQEPETFHPERWLGSRSDCDKHLFNFGLGPRKCLGQELVWKIVDVVVSELMAVYQWRLVDGQDTTHKYLPVSRPRNSVVVTLHKLQF